MTICSGTGVRHVAWRYFNLFLFAFLLLVASLPVRSAQAQAVPTFTKTFTPDTVGPGSVTTLRFDITNNHTGAISSVAFTDTLPAAITIANPSNLSISNCAGTTAPTLTAPAGGGTITFTNGGIGIGGTCTITVDVTSSTVGTHTNTTGTLTSSMGNAGTASDDLTVVAARPGFSKSFSPASVSLGGRSTLTFTIDNSANVGTVFTPTFTDNLPSGTEIASPANATTTCPVATLTAPAGGSTISFTGITVAGGAICTVSVDIKGTVVGTHTNVSGELLTGTFPQVSSGKATDALTVTGASLLMTKTFTNDPVVPGGTVTLNFTIQNNDRTFTATGLAFTDDLTTLVPSLAGLTFSSLLSNDCGGSVTGVGGTTIGLSGGTLAPEGSCTVSTSLTVPAGTATGNYANTSGTVSATINGVVVVGNMATDTLRVDGTAPVLTKEFTDDPVGPGQAVTLQFTITNPGATALTGITFEDVVSDAVAGLFINSGPAAGFCGAGSTTAISNINVGFTNENKLTVIGASLAPAGSPGDSCTFSFNLTVPAGAAGGSYLNTTSAITAVSGASTVTGLAASDSLVVAGSALVFSKQFTDDPVLPGGTATLEFTITNPAENTGGAAAVTFTDDLAAALTGLSANLPSTPNPPCGAGSSLTGAVGNTLLTLAGGTLAAGASCTFSVTTNVPAGAAQGNYINTTSTLSATVSGITVNTPGASDTLQVSGLTFTKEFINDPVVPGGTATLRFSIENTHPTDNATITSFTDAVNANLPGLAATGGPSVNTCGGTLVGTTTLSYTGGTVLPGQTCTIEVDLLVPAGTLSGSYGNTTSNLTVVQGGPVIVPPASDVLVVESTRLALTKSFTDDPVSAGTTATLEFTLTNLDPLQAASSIDFSDDLDAMLTGAQAASALFNDCNGMAALPASTFTYNGGSIAAGGSCTIRIAVSVPAGAAPGAYSNTTSGVTGTIGGFAVTGASASDNLAVTSVTPPDFSKTFSGPSVATGTPTLTFTITNNDATNALTGLSFSDNLNVVVSGLVATGFTTNTCGGTVSGTSLISFTGGTVAPSTSCTIVASLQVPGAASAGVFPNTTSDLNSSGIKVADPATASLTIEPPPTFAKVFAPDSILFGGTSTLTFTIDNSASALAASALDFTDNLPAGVTVATPANASTTCAGGTLTAVSGSGVISYTGGTVGAAATCTVRADVTSMTAGMHVNLTGALTSSSGNSGTATDTLTVIDQPPSFAKAFAPNPINAGTVSTLTFTIDNSASAANVTALDFTDNLPAGLVVATPSNASTTCTGGTLTAADGAGVISYTGGSANAGSACTVRADVTSNVAGNYVNTTGNLTSSFGNSGTATDTLVVNFVPVVFSKVFTPNTTLTNGNSILTLTLDNTGSAVDATSVDITDNMPAAIEVASPLRAVTTCTGGVLTAVSGTNNISYTGGTVPAGTACVVNVEVTGTTAGIHTNTTGDLTTSLGNSGTATDDLNVTDLPPVFSKVFASDTIDAGAVSTLTFTINNGAATVAATALDFTDNLPAAISVATPANASTTCTGGTLTAASGTSVVSYSGGTVSGSASCTVSVDVTSVVSGAHVNLTEDLTSSLGNSGKAADTLNVNFVVPGFSKVFAPDSILVGEVSTLTFSIDNSGSLVTATALDFVDNMPAGITVANPSNASTTCLGGTLTAASGSSTINYTGGSVNSGICTISVDVTSSTAGSHVNTTGDLTSSLGNSGTAADTLDVASQPLPVFTKQFAPDSILTNEISKLTFTIDNSAATIDATALDFTDNMPAAITIANPANGSTTCTGGTITAASGSSSITYTGGTVATGATCEVSVDVTSSTAGSHVNTTGDLTSSLGNSGTATDTLDVADPAADLSVTLADDVDPVTTGNPLVYTATIANNGPQDASNVVATITLPAGVTFVSTSGCAEDPNGVPVCSLGTIANGANAVVTINVNVNNGTVGTISSQADVVADQADPDPSNNTVTEDTTVDLPLGTITIVKNTAPAAAGDGTFEFSSADPDLDAISLTTVSGTATSTPVAKVAGIYTITEDVATGWVLDALACTGDADGGSVIDLPNREVAIDLDNGETIVCTFTNIRDPNAVIKQTLEAIMDFLEKRADQMTANQPDLVSRLRDRSEPGVAPLEFVGSGTLTSSNSRFSTSLHKVKTWHSNLNGEGTGDTPLWDVWMQGFFSHTKTDTSKSHLGMVHFGADYLINPDLVVGGIVQLDWAGLDSSSTVATVDGFGWMAGPYFVANPWQNIYVDGRVHYGQSYNDVNPIGLYTDQFDTDRFLATLQVTGNMSYGNWSINPAAELLYFHERQKTYVDTLGNTIPSQTLELGRTIFGPQFSYSHVLDNGGELTTSAKLEGIWDFHRKASPLATGTVQSTGGLRGRVDLGLGYRSPSGVSVNASGFYDGIGKSGFESIGGRLEIMVPLQRPE